MFEWNNNEISEGVSKDYVKEIVDVWEMLKWMFQKICQDAYYERQYELNCLIVFPKILS